MSRVVDQMARLYKFMHNELVRCAAISRSNRHLGVEGCGFSGMRVQTFGKKFTDHGQLIC